MIFMHHKYLNITLGSISCKYVWISSYPSLAYIPDRTAFLKLAWRAMLPAAPGSSAGQASRLIKGDYVRLDFTHRVVRLKRSSWRRFERSRYGFSAAEKKCEKKTPHCKLNWSAQVKKKWGLPWLVHWQTDMVRIVIVCAQRLVFTSF